MWFRVYTWLDGGVAVMPALFQPPPSLEAREELRAIGTTDLELDDLSDGLVEQIGLCGYGFADGLEDASQVKGASSSGKPSTPGTSTAARAEL